MAKKKIQDLENDRKTKKNKDKQNKYLPPPTEIFHKGPTIVSDPGSLTDKVSYITRSFVVGPVRAGDYNPSTGRTDLVDQYGSIVGYIPAWYERR